MERPGRVGRHELDVDARSVAEVGPRVAVLAAVDDVGEDVVEPGVVQEEVHEARAGQLHPIHVGRRSGRQALDELRREVARVATVGLRGREGDVGGPVAVLATGRALEVDLLGWGDADLGEGGAQGGGEGVADHGWTFVGGYRWSRPLTRSTRSRGSNGLVT
jgi:hypothetical protein